MPPDSEDLQRLERKVDRLADAVEKLVLIEERQTTQGARIGAVEQSIAALDKAQQLTDRKLDKWINRGIGVWALAATAFGIYSKLP